MYPSPEHFILLESVDSTNNYAMEMVRDGLADEGTVVVALEQTAGKGQRGKYWKSEAGKNLTLSLVIRPVRVSLDRTFPLSAAIAVGAARFFRDLAGEETTIKWPNDLYWRDRKAGGILIENMIQGGEWNFAVAGMGININQSSFPPELLNPVSLLQITGREWDLIDLAKKLVTHVRDSMQLLTMDENDLLKEYEKLLYKKEEWVRITATEGSSQVSGNMVVKIKGVTPEGKLIVDDGQDYLTLEWGQVRWDVSSS